MSRLRSVFLCVLTSIGVAACGGGGGGNGPVAPVGDGGNGGGGDGDGGGDTGNSLVGEALAPVRFLAPVTTGSGGISATGATTDVLFDETFVPTVKVIGRGNIATLDAPAASSYDGSQRLHQGRCPVHRQQRRQGPRLHRLRRLGRG
ncbi:MAG: hypothetical protein R3C97_03665 [Geminicoccaceae bacterium]